MKNLFFTGIFSLLLHFSTSAQLRFGVVGGIQSSYETFSTTTKTLSIDAIIGYNIGAIAEYELNEKFFIRPQVLLSSKGGRNRKTLGDFVSLTYLEIPIHAVYKYEVGNGKIFGGIGPSIGIGISGKDNNSNSVNFGSTLNDDIERLDLGISIIGGYELTDQNLAINLFYTSSLLNLTPKEIVSFFSTSTRITNSTFGLSVAYFIRKK